ncbi:MAG: outer membrane protein transport protein [Magnetococcales bacterium]|nr:outer membrane protein transport protein [Magnetococcales bacterium]
MRVQPLGFMSLLAITMLSAVPVYASNGYFSHGFGTANKAMAGAGVAVPTDSMATAINPALMAHVGNRMDMGVSVFAPVRGFTADTPSATPPGVPFIPTGTYEKDDDFFLIPHFGWNKMLDSTSSFGVSVGGNGGMNTEYNIPVFGNFAPPGMTTAPTSIDLSQMFVGITYANRITPEHTLGIAPVLAGQRISVKGLQPFMGLSSHPDSVTNNGYNYSYGGGLKLGWYWTPNDIFAVGASYQSRLYMTPFDKYKGLFAEDGDFDIPPVIQFGIAVKPASAWTIALDVQKLMFSDIKSVANSNDVLLIPGTVALGPENGLGFGWKDMTVYKLGVQWQADDDWILRVGYSIANQVVPSKQALFNILAPATVTQHLTLGASWAVNANSSINVAASHAFDKRVYGSNPNTPFQTGSLDMYQNELEFSWSYRF